MLDGGFGAQTLNPGREVPATRRARLPQQSPLNSSRGDPWDMVYLWDLRDLRHLWDLWKLWDLRHLWGLGGFRHV